MHNWPIFICYRQSDGMPAAMRIFELLRDREVPRPNESDPDAPPPRLDIYFDQAAPGVSDWQAVHEPYLKRARAMIVICTPGSKLNEGPSDWVHREIDWWLANRDMAPILVDPLGEEMRYVPDTIAQKWPNSQRIKLMEKEWEGLPEEARRSLDERLRSQFIGAIIPSGDRFYRQELEQEQARAARLRRARQLITGLVAGMLAVAAIALWVYNLKLAAESARQTAELATRQELSARRMAEDALKLAQIRVLEGQMARTQAEAGLLGELGEFNKFKAYRETIKAWQADFEARADSLRQKIETALPLCRDAGRFTVYEGQLVEVALDGLPEQEAMYAYLAVVPGSSPRAGDWAPVVLEIFFGDRNELRPGRNLKRTTVQARMKSVPDELRWSLLIGLGSPHLLTHRGHNYRIRQTRLSMHDDGDMVMGFDICAEG